jgi:hypothetical protein
VSKYLISGAIHGFTPWQADYAQRHESVGRVDRRTITPGTFSSIMYYPESPHADLRDDSQLLFDVDYAYAEFFRSLSSKQS